VLKNPSSESCMEPTASQRATKQVETLLSRVWENSNPSNYNSFSGTYDDTISFSNVRNANKFGSTNERAEILAWLSPLEPWTRHHDIKAHRVERVGDWLFQTEEYRKWFNGTRGGNPEDSALFCHGGPGVGKTFIR